MFCGTKVIHHWAGSISDLIRINNDNSNSFVLWGLLWCTQARRFGRFLGYTEKDIELLYPYKEKVFYTIMRESGYLHIQATKPDTVGCALNDSPVGLAAYILEKFSTWTKSEYLGDPPWQRRSLMNEKRDYNRG
ncbi:epoxide hydrolase 1-like [Rattus norvegicus]|uniref:epoxide hydrolase 1-like n=1 Tax=Rattus norvegicus TaxID=10116 RepID=UPI0004E47258|nr:epoxide hydrolase 1-like [Rattus norvegicus]|eukprot:XP_008768102.1 PREDICTED: epoxide hydrolase 1-like [Rattus norvegicus]